MHYTLSMEIMDGIGCLAKLFDDRAELKSSKIKVITHKLNAVGIRVGLEVLGDSSVGCRGADQVN